MGRTLPFLYIMSVNLEKCYGGTEEEQLVKTYTRSVSKTGGKDPERRYCRCHRKVLSRNRLWEAVSRVADIKT